MIKEGWHKCEGCNKFKVPPDAETTDIKQDEFKVIRVWLCDDCANVLANLGLI